MSDLRISSQYLMCPTTAPYALSANSWALWTRASLFVASGVRPGHPLGFDDCLWLLGGIDPKQAIEELLAARMFVEIDDNEYSGWMPCDLEGIGAP